MIFSERNPAGVRCLSDREPTFRILQESDEYCANTGDLQSLDEVLLRIEEVIDVVELRLDELEHPSGEA